MITVTRHVIGLVDNLKQPVAKFEYETQMKTLSVVKLCVIYNYRIVVDRYYVAFQLRINMIPFVDIIQNISNSKHIFHARAYDYSLIFIISTIKQNMR